MKTLLDTFIVDTEMELGGELSAFAMGGGFQDGETEGEVNRRSREYVKWVQTSLNSVINANLRVDGISGSKTRSAVRTFQKRFSLTVDGVVGPRTEAVLISTTGTVPPAATSPGAGPKPLGPKPSGTPPAGPVLFNHPYPRPTDRGAPFALGGVRPFFPVRSSKNPRFGEVAYRDAEGRPHGNMSRAFKANRGARYHAAIDLYANPGDIVVAPESGTVVGRQTFYKGTGAILVETDSGVVVLLGETAMGGADEFGIRTGSRVTGGQPISRVGRSTSGSHMLHTETYTAGTKRNSRWYKDRARPANLLDPTDYLLRAKARLETGG